MKRVVIAVFTAAFAWGQAKGADTAISFDGGAGAPTFRQLLTETVRASAGKEIVPSPARAGIPQRAPGIVSAAEKLAKRQNKASGEPYGCQVERPILVDGMECLLECCKFQECTEWEGSYCQKWEYSGMECNPIWDSCRPLPRQDGAVKAAGGSFLMEFLSARRKAARTRGPYEDCVNDCIAAWQDCTDTDAGKTCIKAYNSCINACDGVVERK